MKGRLFKLALALACLVTVCPAVAAPSPPGLPDPSQTGSLTLYNIDNDGHPSLGTYELYPVTAGPHGKVNTSTQSGWLDIIALMENPLVVHPVTLDPEGIVKSTGPTGIVTWNNLATGLYYVIETAEAGSGSLAMPFLISIPIYDSNASNWIWNVQVAPKKQVCSGGIADLGAAILLEQNGGPGSTVQVGDEITYEFTITNYGPQATPVIAAISIPDGLQIIADNFPDEFDLDTRDWSIPNLDNGDSITLKVRVLVADAGQHPVTMLLSGVDTCDPNENNNYYDPVITATPKDPSTDPDPDLLPPTDVQITLDFDEILYDLSDDTAIIPLLIKVTNNGPGKATGVKAKVDVPPAYEKYQRNTKAIDWPGKADGSVPEWDLTKHPISFGSIHFDIGDLAKGESVSYLVTGRLTCPYFASLPVHGEVGHAEADTNFKNDADNTDATTKSPCDPALHRNIGAKLKVSVSTYTETADGIATWLVDAKNAGVDTAKNTHVYLIVDGYHPEEWAQYVTAPTGTSIICNVDGAPVAANPCPAGSSNYFTDPKRPDKQLMIWSLGNLAPSAVATSIRINIPTKEIDSDGDVCVTGYITSPDDLYQIPYGIPIDAYGRTRNFKLPSPPTFNFGGLYSDAGFYDYALHHWTPIDPTKFDAGLRNNNLVDADNDGWDYNGWVPQGIGVMSNGKNPGQVVLHLGPLSLTGPAITSFGVFLICTAFALVIVYRARRPIGQTAARRSQILRHRDRL